THLMKNPTKRIEFESKNSISKTSFLLLSLIIFLINLLTVKPATAQTTLFSTNFENATSTFGANGWTVVNQWTNKWIVGTAIPYQGTKGAFISNNDGWSNAYTNSTWQNAHFYRDVAVPAGATDINLSFVYKGVGEVGWDRLLVYTAPTSVTPTTGYPLKWESNIPGATLVFTQTATRSSFVTQN